MSIRSVRKLAALALVALLPAPVFGAPVISEIMYDLPGSDQGREWIEIQNGGESPIDLKGWKLAEAGVNHKIISVQSSLIAPRAYAVIVDDAVSFRADWPAFDGVMFTSSFSLSNTGETISLKDASSTVLASAAYNDSFGATGDGNSLNAVDGGWKALAPSPGRDASQTAIVPPPKAGNLKPPSAVRDTQKTAAPANSPRPAQAAAAAIESAPPAREQQPADPAPSAILPWIGGLLLVSAGGTLAILLGRRKNRSGYEIIEEES